VLLERDPEFTRRDSVYFYLGECFMKASRPAEALPYYDQLLKEFDQSEHLVDAQKRVDAIKAQMADPSNQVKKSSGQ